MKPTEFVITAALIIGTGSSGIALAQTAVAGAGSQSQSQSGAAAGSASYGYAQGGGGGGGGSSQLITNNGNTYEAVDMSERVPGVIMPALTTSNGTCMGSTSGGIGISGFGGSFGSTYTSNPCNVRFNANQMNALGQPELALEMMCSQDSVYEADLRRGLAGGKQVCTKRDEVSVDPVATWFPEEGTSEYVMQDDGMLHYVDDGLPTGDNR